MSSEQSLDMILLPFKTVPGPAPVNAIRDRIEKIYALPIVERIVAALAADSSPGAREEHDALLKKCPMSLKVTLRLLHGCPRKFIDNMLEEYRIAVHMSARPDFREGVRAVLIDKDNRPKWNPAKLHDVTEDMVDEVFYSLPPGEEWTPVP
jgi:enoyl-CoA hydratase